MSSCETVRRRELLVEAARSGPVVGAGWEAVHLQVGEGAGVAERPGELGHPVGDAAEAADHADPLRGERVQVGRGWLGGPGELGRGQMADPGKAPRRGAHRAHRRSRAYRCGGEAGVADEGGHDIGDGQVAVGSIPGVVPAGQPGEPVWGEQPQAGPALRPPRVRHLTVLEDDVVDGAFGEAAAHGKAGVAGADDDSCGFHHSGCWTVVVRPARRARSSG
jgi:hypothetical protein